MRTWWVAGRGTQPKGAEGTHPWEANEEDPEEDLEEDQDDGDGPAEVCTRGVTRIERQTGSARRAVHEAFGSARTYFSWPGT